MSDNNEGMCLIGAVPTEMVFFLLTRFKVMKKWYIRPTVVFTGWCGFLKHMVAITGTNNILIQHCLCYESVFDVYLLTQVMTCFFSHQSLVNQAIHGFHWLMWFPNHNCYHHRSKKRIDINFVLPNIQGHLPFSCSLFFVFVSHNTTTISEPVYTHWSWHTQT